MNPRIRSAELAALIIYWRNQKVNGATTVPIDDMLQALELWLGDTGFGPQQQPFLEDPRGIL